MRWGQVNIREHEAAKFDVEWWEAYWKEARLDGIVLNTGGIVAYYPTELSDHHRSRWLGDRDLFGELVDAIKRCGMKILARIDPGESYEDVYFRRPDWFAIDAKGAVLRDVADPALYVPCMNGPYYLEFVPRIIKEIHSRYDVDGIFGSEWDGRGRICHCHRCSTLFRDATGLELPAAPDPGNLAWKQWVRWHEGRLSELWQFWDNISRSIKPGAFYMGNHSERGFLAEIAEMINVDQQSRVRDTPLWVVGEEGKKMRAVTGETKPYFHIFSSNSYARHVAKPAAEMRLYIADALLADSKPWFTIIGGCQDDGRQFGPIQDMYRWHGENQEFLRNRRSLAEVAIVFDDRDRFIKDNLAPNSFRGMYYAMLRGRVPFDLIHLEHMTADQLARYRLVILPNRACMRDEEAALLAAFARSGGALMATFETGMRDEWGNRRKKGLLDDLFGIAGRSTTLGPLVHAYASLHGPHPLLAGLEETSVTHCSKHVSPVVPREGTESALMTFIPPYTIYPPERAFSRIGDTGMPLALLSGTDQDAGRRIYWSGDVDALIYNDNAPDHVKLMSNAVAWALHDNQRVKVHGPGLVEFHLYAQEDNLQVHLVNLSNPDVWRAPVHEILRIGAQRIRLRVPEGRQAVDEATCLVSGDRLPVKNEDGWAIVDLPGIDDHEVVVLGLR
jgi:hypothetical protein